MLHFDTSTNHDQTTDPQQLQLFLQRHKSQFERELIPDLSHIGQLAYNSHGIEVLAVEALGVGLYRLHYRFDWQVSRGCADINLSGHEQASVRFTLGANGEINFEPVPQSRDSADEL